MSILLVTYDLVTPGQKYASLHKHIEDNYTWCKGLESVYLLDTTVTVAVVRDRLN